MIILISHEGACPFILNMDKVKAIMPQGKDAPEERYVILFDEGVLPISTEDFNEIRILLEQPASVVMPSM